MGMSARELSVEQKRNVLGGKLRFHRETYYSFEVDAKVARDIGLPAMLESAIKGMTQVQLIIDTIEKMLLELQGDAATSDKE